jgi:two-component system, LytTR family, response regulator
MLNCYVIDDETAAINVLKLYINDTPGLHYAGATSQPLEFLQSAKNLTIDLLFLDVQMPKLSGLELLKAMGKNVQFKVALVTGFGEYALDSYNFDVIDYLMKPVDYARFIRTIEKYNSLASNAIKSLTPANQDFFFVKTGQRDQKVIIYYEELDYVESDKNYVSFYCGSQRVVSIQSLKELETILPTGKFSRVHQSFIINHSRISTLKPDEVVLRLKRQKEGRVSIPIGEKYRSAFYEKIGAV